MKYFASASFRRDASSRFHPDNRWGNFWSLGGAWIVSKESWFNDFGIIDILKLKASYGENGNDGIGSYRYVNTYDIVNANGSAAAVPASMGNKEITWETVGNFNTGIEFSLWKNRLSGQVEYFARKTSDMLYSFPLPPSFGFSSYYANVGDMTNKGIEVELEGEIIRRRDFNWSVSLNLTHYKNEISSMPEQRKPTTVEGHGGYASGNYFLGEGLPLYTYYMPQYAGVAQEDVYNEQGRLLYGAGQPLWWKDTYATDENGVTVKDEKGNPVVNGREVTGTYSEACGTALPDIYGGFGTKVNYKGIDFAIDFTYQIGGQCYDSDYASLMASPSSGTIGRAFHADLLKAWTPENPSTTIPRWRYSDLYNGSQSDRFLTDASYIALQNITVGYTLPTKWVRQAGLASLRVYFTADNVFVHSKRQGLDPRQSISGSVTNAYYAPIRTLTGGLTVTF